MFSGSSGAGGNLAQVSGYAPPNARSYSTLGATFTATEEQGPSLVPIKSPNGVGDVGYGHNLPSHGQDPKDPKWQNISQTVANNLLKGDLGANAKWLNANLTVAVSQTQFDALLDACHGGAGYAKGLVAFINQHGSDISKYSLDDLAGLAAAFQATHAPGDTSESLRRSDDFNLFRTGSYVTHLGGQVSGTIPGW